MTDTTSGTEPDGLASTLWAVHVQGPDSLIAQPDKATAEQRADEWTRMAAQVRERAIAEGMDLPNLVCVAAPWPYDPASHAEELAEHGGNPDDIC